MVANSWGRKITITLTLLLGSASMIVLGFAPNYWMVLIFYGLMGISIPVQNFSALWLGEIGNKEWREIILSIVFVSCAIFEEYGVAYGFIDILNLEADWGRILLKG